MIARGLTLFALLATAQPALAQEEREVIDLPAGQLVMTVNRDNFTGQVSDGRTSLPLDTGYMPYVAARTQESALIFIASGGTACPGLFTWVTLDPAGLRMTEGFGTCSDMAEVSQTEGGPMAVMPDYDGTRKGYVFDGVKVSEVNLGLSPAGVENPGVAASWAGKSAYEVLAAAEMEATLRAIMPQDVLEEARRASSVASADQAMSPDGEWFAAIGCQPHDCGYSGAGVAMSTRDGRVIAVRWTHDGGGVVYGQPDSPLPRRLQDMLNGTF